MEHDRRWPVLGIFGAALVLVTIIVAVAAPFLAPHDPLRQSLADRLLPPVWEPGGSSAHLIGTDNLGRDVLSRLFFGARISLLVGFGSITLAGVVGSVLGAIAGYVGGRVDDVIMRVVDVWLAFPFLLLTIALAAALGPGLLNMILALGFSQWIVFCRIARVETLSLRQREFVLAARSVGADDIRILRRHVIPNLLPILIVIGALDIALVIVSEATLSFLGLGVEAGTPTWGGMLADSQQFMRTAWWLVTFPGAAISLLIIGVNLVADALAEVVDPRLRYR